MIRILSIVFLPTVFLTACKENKPQSATTSEYKYTIDDQALYDTITKLDSIFFDAYNHCATQLDKHAAFYSDSVEFFHDKGGFENSKDSVVAGIKKYVCGKVTRELIPGSLEIYPINNYGAVEMGLHKFHNSEEPDAPSHPSRFTIIWQHTAGGWKIKKVISLH